MKFWKSYLPFLMNFVLGRIILQSDLIMASAFGMSASIAFGIPMRVMILDIVFAFALAPVISVRVAKAQDEEDRRLISQNSLSIGFWLGMALAIIGLIIYRPFVKSLSANQEIADLAWAATFWLSISVPFRIQQFVAAMILHGSGRGGKTTAISFIIIPLNIFLNYIFGTVAHQGMTGIFISTFLVSVLSLILHLRAIEGALNFSSYRFQSWPEVHKLIQSIIPELGRLTSERILAFILLGFFTWLGADEQSTGAFIICTEFLILISTPFVALMRARAVMGATPENSFSGFLKTEGALLILLFLVSVGINLEATYFFKNVYHVDSVTTWYIWFVRLLPILLILKWFSSNRRGILQSNQNLKAIFWSDLLSQWLVLVPLCIFAVMKMRPELYWSSFVLSEGVGILLLNENFLTWVKASKKINLSN